MSGAIKILIVDDDPGDVRIAGRILRSAGEGRFALRGASMLEDAIATLESVLIDLVVLDLGLPDAQGVQTVETLIPYLAGTPLVVVTGDDAHDIETACLEAGASFFLPKSRVAGELLRVVEFALRCRSLPARPYEKLSKILTHGLTLDPSVDDRVLDQLDTQLHQIERGLSLHSEHEATARRVRSLAARLVELGLPPALLLERAVQSPNTAFGPNVGALLVVATQLGQVYFEQARTKHDEGP